MDLLKIQIVLQYSVTLVVCAFQLDTIYLSQFLTVYSLNLTPPPWPYLQYSSGGTIQHRICLPSIPHYSILSTFLSVHNLLTSLFLLSNLLASFRSHFAYQLSLTTPLSLHSPFVRSLTLFIIHHSLLHSLYTSSFCLLSILTLITIHHSLLQSLYLSPLLLSVRPHIFGTIIRIFVLSTLLPYSLLSVLNFFTIHHSLLQSLFSTFIPYFCSPILTFLCLLSITHIFNLSTLSPLCLFSPCLLYHPSLTSHTVSAFSFVPILTLFTIPSIPHQSYSICVLLCAYSHLVHHTIHPLPVIQ